MVADLPHRAPARAAGGKRCRPQSGLYRLVEEYARSDLIGGIRYSIGRGLPTGSSR